MRYAVLSDVHGNLEALEAVLQDCGKIGIDRILFLGDVVGYGADPQACLERLTRTAGTMIMGNHDMACATGSGIETMNQNAARAVLWTREILDSEGMEFLRSLPMDHYEDDMYLVHGSPYQPNDWHYILTEQDAELGFVSSRSPIVFVGHTHKPVNCIEVKCKRIFGGEVRRIEMNNNAELRFENDRRYIINVGSVGQPRDRDPRAAYGLYDSESRIFLIRKVTYDWDKASGKILGNGLPGFLADRLKDGI